MSLKTAKRKAWKAFSDYILSSHQTKIGIQCFTCKRWYQRGRGMHAGHFQPGRYNIFLYDVRQVWPQCYRCNINLKGNWPRYYEEMVNEFGKEEVEKMIQDGKKVKQMKEHDYEEIYLKYKGKLKVL